MSRLVEFYSLLGLVFEYHKHGNSPYHHSAKIDGLVLEIYPLAKDQKFADKNLRIGFSVANFDEVIGLLDACILSAPIQTEWGEMAIVQDPDGRKVEIYKK